MKLLIVESPTKAKTISKFLGDDFDVDSSYGHVRDLPKTKMGVDIEHNYDPSYRVPRKASKHVKRLKKKAKKADAIYLATDEDREGEAIAWHLSEALGLNTNDAQRLVFHEITKSAIDEALEHPRGIAMDLVDAQQARRILDRLVGYTLSPLLWRKVARGLSAGRVQSVAVRLIVDRERERDAFEPREYWSIEAKLRAQRDADGADDESTVMATLWKQDGKRVKKMAIGNKKEADTIVKDISSAKRGAATDAVIIAGIKQKERKRNPSPPYTTSTLQQDAARRLHFSAKRTMTLAQMLYETGLITYMRTDSVNIAEQALTESRSHISETFGSHYLPTKPRRFKTKQQRAQEAHEAIRPTDATKTPESLKSGLDAGQCKLYRLIWGRFLASQMTPAVFRNTTADVTVPGADHTYTFRARGQILVFDGFTRAYPINSKEELLPPLHKYQSLHLDTVEGTQHFTQPPPRYTEASLVKELESNGIGRPSTYAPIISTIQQRGYVTKERRAFAPTEIGTVVNNLLVEHFPTVVDIGFTAEIEDKLDAIAAGNEEWVPTVRLFYEPLAERVAQKDKELDKKDIAIEETDETCEECGKPMVIRLGRYGRFLACTGFPDCRNTRSLEDMNDANDTDDANGAQSPFTDFGSCPECGDGTLRKRNGRFGPFLGCTEFPDCTYTQKMVKNDEGADMNGSD